MDTSIEESERTRYTLNLLADFANIFKAFIGANFLSIPYGLMQSGLVTGVVGLLLVAALTNHCCHLLVTCKEKIVTRIVKEFRDVTHEPTSDIWEVDESEMRELRERVEANVTYSDIGRICMGRIGVILVSSSLLITQFSFCVAYFIFIGNSLYRMIHPSVTSQLALQPEFNSQNQSNISSGLSLIYNNVSNTAYSMSVTGPTHPRLELLILSPLPIFLLLSLIRQIRQLAFISVLANCSLLLGFIAITAYIAADFSLGKDINYIINLHSFPVFFGQLTSAYEGIGLIIPIQCSMVGNRQHFSSLLSTAIFTLTCIFLVFGLLGYLKYGSSVTQSINLSITPSNGVLSLIINISLITGILFTFSLQMMPIYDIIEPLIFTKEKSYNDESQNLLNNKMPLPVRLSTNSNPNVVSWRRNLLRTGIVAIAAIIAIACKDIFAYVIAISGGLGSTILAFILPAVFHMKLDDGSLPAYVIVKDGMITILGILGGFTSITYSIMEIIHITKSVK